MTELFEAVADLVMTWVMSTGFLIGLALGLIAGFSVWWLLSGSELQGIGSAGAFVGTALIVGAVRAGRGTS